MEAFCGSPFWDNELTWNTTDPFFTHCFEETILTWAPLGVFFLLLSLSINTIMKINRKDKLNWNWNTCTYLKCAICVGLTIVSFVNSVFLYNNYGSMAYIFSANVRMLSYILTLLLLAVSQICGMRSSGLQFSFWFTSLLCEAILFRTAVRKYEDADSDHKKFLYMLRFLTFPMVSAQFILQCCPDEFKKTSDDKCSNFKNPCPEKNSTFFSKILFLWFDGMALLGYRKSLTYSDLWDLNAVDRAKTQVPMFFKYWNAAQHRIKQDSQNNSKTLKVNIVSVLAKMYGFSFVFGGILKMLQDLLAFVSPEILRMLVAHVAVNSTEEPWKGYLYAGILFVTCLLQTILGVQYIKRMLIIGMRLRTVLSSAVYRKALVVSNGSKKDSAVGGLVNLISVDTQNLMDLMPVVHMIWTSPLRISLAVYFLYHTLGNSVFSGLAVMVLLIPANSIIAGKVRVLQIRQMFLKDKRVKLTSEILSQIKVLKLYAWEISYKEQVQSIRTEEIKILKQVAFLNSITSFSFTCAPFLVALATFATYVLSSNANNLNAEKAFVSLTLFNIMRMPLTMFPTVVTLMVQSNVSVRRINEFMNSEEIRTTEVTHDNSERDPIVVESGTFSWRKEATTLRNINLRVKKGSFVAIVGSVGSGKSSLLNCLLGELMKSSGENNVNGSIAFASQAAWIRNASLKENILFGEIFDELKYEKVVDACALAPDFAMFSAGDETEMGEKGINLSGGQKQRIALARAVYRDSDIYLLDDPLSAVDSLVGKHIFDNLFGPKGILNDKTKVLVTHNLAYLPQVDEVIMIEGGEIMEHTSYKQILHNKGNVSEILNSPSIMSNTENEIIDSGIHQVLVDTYLKPSSIISESITKQKVATTEENADVNANIIEEEDIAVGSVKLKVYMEYFKASGPYLLTISLAFNLFFQALSTYSSIWLSNWSDQAEEDEIKNDGVQMPKTTSLYLSVYGTLCAAQAATILIATITLALAALNSAYSIHEKMLSVVIKAPMTYYHATPIGRLVNRFSKDIDTIDNMLPLNIRSWLNIALSILSTILVICYSTPIFLAFIVPCGAVYLFCQIFYVATARQLKRMESVSRSPIYSALEEAVSGATTIRAFQLQGKFISEAEKKIDDNQKVYYAFITSNLWIAVRLETIGSLIVFASALFAVLARETIHPSILGLSVSYALQLTSLLNFLVRTSTELESNIISVEKVKELMNIPQEANWINNNRPQKDWPQKGIVQFKNYSTRYREGLNLVLNEISCTIKDGEKVGVVGRTGAGKSSLTLALFRIIEPTSGYLYIDGQDVTEIGLYDLRSKLSIIPQDPMLFSGTIRSNLDPFNVYTDDQLWKCLDLANLKIFFSNLPGGLLYKVADGGHNFSVGQRQLICLSRALLRKTKIVVLDEATAAIDLETELLIQKTIKGEFASSTVITIAHRINTIMDSNRVLVVDKGKIVDFDSPQNLLNNRNSIFFDMAKEAEIFK